MENLQSKLTSEMCQGRTGGEFTLTVLMRKYEEEDQTYFVAECLEIPGCVADGETEDKAAENLHEAFNACIGVIVEDAFKMARSRTSAQRDYTGITSQRTIHLPISEVLQYA